MSLGEWLNRGWVGEHKTSPQEVQQLLGVADRDVENSKVEGLSADWRLSIAHNAILLTATAALAACGYEAARRAQPSMAAACFGSDIGRASNGKR